MGYRKIFAFAVLITAACSWNGAPATADIRNAPPAPSISFTVQPRFQSVRGTQVYTWSNDPGRYNIYRFGGVYYLSSDGWWYRSGSMTGPYDVVEEVTIPRQVVMAYSPGDQYNGDPYNGDQGNAYNDDYDDRYAPNPPRITVSGNPQFLTVPGTSASFWVNGMSGVSDLSLQRVLLPQQRPVVVPERRRPRSVLLGRPGGGAPAGDDGGGLPDSLRRPVGLPQQS